MIYRFSIKLEENLPLNVFNIIYVQFQERKGQVLLIHVAESIYRFERLPLQSTLYTCIREIHGNIVRRLGNALRCNG